MSIFDRFPPGVLEPAVLRWEIPAGAWTGPHRKHSFPHRFQAGRESDGRPLYIAQATHQGWGASVGVVLDELGKVIGGGPRPFKDPDTWHIGKAGVHLKDGATYSYDGEERDADKYFVFAPDDPDRFTWAPGSEGSYPPGAIAGINGTENQIVARMNWAGGVHPGKLIPGSRACFIGYGGGEKASRDYEVLVRRP